jgi:hypothetical protein
MSAALASTLPAPPDPTCAEWKKCSCCGTSYSYAEWFLLAYVGNGMGLEYRNCVCGSTLTVPVEVRNDDHARDEGDDAMAEERAASYAEWRERSW